jgi:hypothetical protein
MPVYPAAMSPLPQPMTGQVRWHPAKVTAAVLCFVALVLVVASSFLPLGEGELSFGPESIQVTFTAWSGEYSGDFADQLPPGDTPKVGYPIVFAAVALACAAAACWYAATPTASPVSRHVAGVTTAVSGAFLIGTVWTTAVMVSNGVDSFVLYGTFGQGLDSDASYLAGYWLLLTAAFLGAVASVLSLLPARQAVWVPPPVPVNPFVPTPPYGIAVPQPFPGSFPGPVEPLAGQHLVDPLTGQPLGQSPVAGQPVPPPAEVPAQPVPFTPEPVGQVNGTPPPIVVPDAPPLPETPPGPAIPATEDPLAEPPSSSR